MKNNCYVIILSGGNSLRMGYPKAFLPFDEGETFLSHLLEVYLQFGCEQQIVMLNKDLAVEKYNLHLDSLRAKCKIRVLEEPSPDRLYSVRSGLKEVPADNYVFIQDVDMPLTSVAILEKLWEKKIPDAYAVPQFEGISGHPVLFGPHVARKIMEMPYEESTLRKALENFPRRKVRV